MLKSVRIVRLSRVLQGAVVVITLAILAGGAYLAGAALSGGKEWEMMLREASGYFGPVALTPAATMAVAAIFSAELALLLTALYCVWRMFGAFAGDEPLSPASASWMRRAGLVFVVLSLSRLASRTLVVLAITYGNPPGQRSLSIGLGSVELLTFLVAGILYMTSLILALAAEVRADQKGFV